MYVCTNVCIASLTSNIQHINDVFADRSNGHLAILAYQNGTVVGEQYASHLGVDASSLLLGWSMRLVRPSLFPPSPPYYLFIYLVA